MKIAHVAAMLAAYVCANSNADDTTGIFGNDEQWKSGLVKIDKLDDIFYWMFNSR